MLGLTLLSNGNHSTFTVVLKVLISLTANVGVGIEVNMAADVELGE